MKDGEREGKREGGGRDLHGSVAVPSLVEMETKNG